MSKSKTKNINKKSSLNLDFLKKIAPKLNFKKFEWQLLGLFMLIQVVLAGLSVYENSFQFAYTFLSAYYITLICIFLISSTVLFFTFRNYTKKTFGVWFYVFYLITTLLLSYNVISLNPSIENITNRAFFSNSGYLFIVLILTLVLTAISKYDFPISENYLEFYQNSMSHLKRNIGVFFVIAAFVTVLSFYAESFIYAVSYVLIIDSIYVLKALLANIRK